MMYSRTILIYEKSLLAVLCFEEAMNKSAPDIENSLHFVKLTGYFGS